MHTEYEVRILEIDLDDAKKRLIQRILKKD